MRLSFPIFPMQIVFYSVMKIGVYPNCNQTTDRHEAEIRKKLFAKEKCLHVTGEVGK